MYREAQGFRIGVLGRKRILTEIVRLQSRSTSPRLQLEGSATADPGDVDDLAEPEPEPEPGAEDGWEEEPEIMLIGDEEHVNMLLFLDLADLASMARVSKHWRTLISGDLNDGFK